MKIAVIQGPSSLEVGDQFWNQLARELPKSQVDTLILNELPFGPWIASEPYYNEQTFRDSMKFHDDAISAVSDLGVSAVIGTKPAIRYGAMRFGVRVNQGFVWERETGECAIHEKQFFPNHPGYHESEWYGRGKERFGLFPIGAFYCGLLICTDAMFNEWARGYGRRGAQLICVPRATSSTTRDRWKTVLSMTAIVSGCYVASSNRCGVNFATGNFGGSGMIVSPRGELLAETSDDCPIATWTLDANVSEQARKDYPCSVRDLLTIDRFENIEKVTR